MGDYAHYFPIILLGFFILLVWAAAVSIQNEIRRSADRIVEAINSLELSVQPPTDFNYYPGGED